MIGNDLGNNINSIKPLYNILNFFALTPPYNTTEKNPLLRYKIWVILFSLILLLAFSGMFYVTIETYNITSKALFMVYILCYSSATLQYLISILISAFWKIEKFYDFTASFHEVDKSYPHQELTQKETPKRILNTFILELVAVHLLFIFLTSLEIYFSFYHVGIINYVYNRLLKRIEMYFITIITLLMFNYTTSLKLRFKKLKMLLKENIKNYYKKKTQVHIDENNLFENFVVFDACCNVRKLRVVFNSLTNMVDQFNTIFGYQIMFLYLYIGIMTLELLGEILHDQAKTVAELYLFDITNMILGIVLAVTCQMTRKEAEEIVTVCYNLMLHIDAKSQNKIDQTVRRELILLAQQATDQCPSFSASGFFVVDYAMLFGLIGTITSYVVVLLQII